MLKGMMVYVYTSTLTSENDEKLKSLKLDWTAEDSKAYLASALAPPSPISRAWIVKNI